MSDTTNIKQKKKSKIETIKKYIPSIFLGITLQTLIGLFLLIEIFIFNKLGIPSLVVVSSFIGVCFIYFSYLFYITSYNVYKSFTDIYSSVESTKFNNKVNEVNIESLLVVKLDEISKKLDGTVIANFSKESNTDLVN